MESNTVESSDLGQSFFFQMPVWIISHKSIQLDDGFKGLMTLCTHLPRMRAGDNAYFDVLTDKDLAERTAGELSAVFPGKSFFPIQLTQGQQLVFVALYAKHKGHTHVQFDASYRKTSDGTREARARSVPLGEVIDYAFNPDPGKIPLWLRGT